MTQGVTWVPAPWSRIELERTDRGQARESHVGAAAARLQADLGDDRDAGVESEMESLGEGRDVGREHDQRRRVQSRRSSRGKLGVEERSPVDDGPRPCRRKRGGSLPLEECQLEQESSGRRRRRSGGGGPPPLCRGWRVRG